MDDLIPVNHKINAANKSPITIDGAILLRLKGTSSDGVLRQAVVMVYISPESPVFLCQKKPWYSLVSS